MFSFVLLLVLLLCFASDVRSKHHNFHKHAFKAHDEAIIPLAASALDEERLQDLLRLLKTVSWMVESMHHKQDFPNQTSVFENQGHIYDVPEQVVYYSAVARSRSNITTICETGFNAGHSAIVWLFSNPNATLHSFDMGVMPYSEKCVDLVRSLFGERFVYHKGNSRELLTPSNMNGAVCDLLSVDGDHSDPYSDIRLGKKVSRPGTLVLVDDFGDSNRNIIKDWNHAVYSRGEHHLLNALELHKNFRWIEVGQYFKGWALGEYAQLPSIL
jgi:hypothetical protein